MKRTQLEGLLTNRLHLIADERLRARCVDEVMQALIGLPEIFVMRRTDGEHLAADEGFEFVVCDSLADRSAVHWLDGHEGVVHRMVPIDAQIITPRRSAGEIPDQEIELDFDELPSPRHLTAVPTDPADPVVLDFGPPTDGGGVA